MLYTISGPISFESCGYGQTSTSLVMRIEDSGQAIVVNTVPSNRARWIFSNSYTPPMFLNAIATTFNAESIFASGHPDAHVSLDSSYALRVSSTGQSYVYLSGSMIVQDMGALIVSTGLSTTLEVTGDLISTSSPVMGIKIFSPANITVAGDIKIQGASSHAFLSIAKLTLKANNLFLSRSATASPFSTFSLGSFDTTNIFVNNVFHISGARYTGLLGGGMELRPYVSVTVWTKTLILEDNHALLGFGGAVWMESAANLTIVATEKITFKGNRASKGGALAANSTAIVNFQSPSISFETNTATIGGALHVYATHATALSRASFQNNIATEACVAYFVDSCPNFVPIGGSNGNLQSVPLSDPNSCHLMSELCQAPPVGCPGSPPTPSAYCDNGIWIVPAEELETSPTVVIESPVIVIGNVTIPVITVTLSPGNGQPLLQSNGCITIGTIEIQLTEEDVKSLEKNGPRSALLTRSNCDSSALISVAGSKSSQSCKKIESTSVREGGSLIATFRVNSSKCNLWWIVLTSVLGAVIVGVVISIIVIKVRQRQRLEKYSERTKPSS